MGRFTNPNGVTFSVSDDKNDRYEGVEGYESADASKAPAKKAAASKTEK